MAHKKKAAITYTPPDRALGEAEREVVTGYSRQQWARLEEAGQVPRRIQLGANKIGWLESELLAWLREKAAQRDQQAGKAAGEAEEQEAEPRSRQRRRRPPLELADAEDEETEPCPGTAAE